MSEKDQRRRHHPFKDVGRPADQLGEQGDRCISEADPDPQQDQRPGAGAQCRRGMADDARRRQPTRPAAEMGEAKPEQDEQPDRAAYGQPEQDRQVFLARYVEHPVAPISPRKRHKASLFQVNPIEVAGRGG